MSDIHQVLADGEKILWEEKPQFLPFVLSTLPVVLFFLAFVVVGFYASFLAEQSPFITPHFLVGMILGPGYLIYSILVHRFVHYVITDKRIIIQKGIVGRDYQGIEHDAVVSTNVSVGLGDKLFGKNSGTVRIIHAGSGQTKNGTPQPTGLVSITDPYKVYQLLNKISHDVRTDIQYPNAMRPEENPGYKTEYKP